MAHGQSAVPKRAPMKGGSPTGEHHLCNLTTGTFPKGSNSKGTHPAPPGDQEGTNSTAFEEPLFLGGGKESGEIKRELTF